MIKIQAYSALKDNYIWLIHCTNENHTLIVDPSDAEPIIRIITKQRLYPVAILNTHHHHDHIDGITKLVDQYHIPVYGPTDIRIPKLSTSVSATNWFKLSPKFPNFTILDLPGHTATHIAYLIHDMLFCGDTIFAAGCGRLLGGSANQLFNSLQNISSLPATTKIFCSHEYTQDNLKFALAVEPDNEEIKQRIIDTDLLRLIGRPSIPTTVAQELATNPFLRCNEIGVVQSARQFAGSNMDNSLAVFSSLRAWKDSF